jgi:long-chain acyl-CoA synthetase
MRDVVASSVPLDTPFGMIVALGSIFSGAGFRFLGPADPIWPSNKDLPSPSAELAALTNPASNEPKPTVLFVWALIAASVCFFADIRSKAHHEALIKSLNNSFRAHPLGSFAARFKLIGIQGGDISRTGRFEKVVWRSIRQSPLGGIAGKQLRSVVVVDGESCPTGII